ncbi:hypothetical protein [Chryseobacterium luquanense]|uniref:DUF4468 domain-containing protein n=1 Tax=Chryseobacterium luquanense TaxID=2983766 RepID=A0ABT3Y228_9FLAO|nr:hypothetical protein [Chryseobacterium luquanense]MCX8532214.1 hypothetical protein [Chryseobacterium luquanense]
MKKLTLFLMVVICGFMFGQNVNTVRKIVEQINQTKGLKIKKIPNSYYLDRNIVTDNGIELKGYYKNNKLLKIEHWVGLSARIITTEYFFTENGKLVFVHSKKYQTVDENGYLEKPQQLSDLRRYYEKDKLIKSVGVLNDDENTDYLIESKNLINDLKNYSN